MASQAHCFYCFDTLSGSFEGREPASLAHVEELYSLWIKSKSSSRVGREFSEELSSSHVGEDSDMNMEDEVMDAEQDESSGNEDEEANDDEAEELSVPAKSSLPSSTSTTLQIPRIGRLQQTSHSESSSSSATSSQSALTNHSSAASSNTSYSSVTARSLSSSFPLFVTWNTISRHNPSQKHLRGCIGTFEAQPLEHGLQTYAITSAFDDTRFSPIPASLLSSLACSITLLANFTPCNDAMDWTLGSHGLRISFVHRGKRYGATYLPDVAVEQGWTKEECVESLMRKAGWDGSSSMGGMARKLLRGSGRSETTSHGEKPWTEVTDFKAVKYTGLKANATYDEWMEWRRWVQK
ncbi:MAG: hypothetical protein Q9160_000275 [Pyrenula sp. 1 TL-2023]